MHLAEKQLADWLSGIDDEIDHWNDVLDTRETSLPDEAAERLDPALPMQDDLISIIRKFDQTKVTILDAGAGPMTWLGKQLDDVTLSITATDFLASAYKDMLKKRNIVPPVTTQFATIEDLSSFFPPASFDIVFCRNALDRAIDPLRGINEMLRCVRVGGSVVLIHKCNNAECENYRGFNQFNLDLVHDRFTIWNQTTQIDIETILQVAVSTRILKIGSDLLVVFTKKDEFVSELDQLRNRTAELAQMFVFAILNSQKDDQIACLRAEKQRHTDERKQVENVLAEERRMALTIRQRITELEAMIANRLKLSYEDVHAIAQEVWFEHQRWGIPYKIGKWIKRRRLSK